MAMTSQTPTLLLIEGFSPDRELYRRYLSADGDRPYRLLEAETVKTGLELCRTEAIDAILLDYLLPDANGLQFLESLHAQSQGNSPPVVIVTSEGDETIAVRAIKLGAEDYLVKRRLTPELLQLTMRSAIENARLRLQLRHQETRFRVSVENMLDCFGIFSAIRDESGQIIDFQIDYLNKAACENNQMIPEEQLGRRLCELLPAHRETGLFDAYCQVVERGEPLFKESLIYQDDYAGRRLLRAFDIHATKLDDGFVASWRNVTARKQAELDRQQQLERERILNQITQQIRRSLNPSEVLNTAVIEVRKFLNADRAFIYRFNPDFSGVIVVESVMAGWSSALTEAVEDTYFMETYGEDYRQGRIQRVADIYQAGLTDCHVAMLERFQIRANLVVPILQGENLWGLLVLNQCADVRQWQASEVELLQQIAAQLGIAIQQAELYQQVQQKQQFIQQISDAAPGFLYIYDLIEQRNIYINQGIVDVLGYAPEEVQAMGEAVLPQLFHPDDFAQVAVRTANLQAAQPGENFESEFRLRHANGEWRWFCARETVYRRSADGCVCQILGVAQEITERKRVEALLRQSQERLELSLSSSQQGIWDYDVATNQAYWSPQCKRLFGLEPDDCPISMEQFLNSVHPDDRDRVAAAVQALYQTSQDYDIEYRVVWADGSVHWIYARGKSLGDAQRQPHQFIGTAVDISDRKRLEAELNQRVVDLQKQQHQLQRLIDTAPIGIGIGGANGAVTVINDEMLRLHGYTREEFEQQGMNWRDFMTPEMAESTEQAMEQLRQAGSLPPQERELVRRDGSRMPIWSSVTQWIENPDEHVAFAVDLTRRKQTEAALQASQQRYQQLADAMPQMVWTADATGLVNYWNQQWYEYTGLNEVESMRLAGAIAVHPADRDRTLEQWTQAVARGIPFEIEHRVCRWDGVYHWFINRGIVTRDHQGQITGWIGTVTDVDELKRSQTEREQLLDQLAAEQQRLQQSEERLQIGIQVAGVAIAHFDYATDQVMLSPEAAALYGFAADQRVITRDQIHATFHPEEHDALMQIIGQVLDPAGAGWFAREHRVVWQNGEVRWLNVRKQVFFDHSTAPPRPAYAILAAIDITERKQAEQDRVLLSRIVESSMDAIIGFTPERKIISWNTGAERIFGYTSAEVLGQDVAMLSPGDRQHECVLVCQRLQRGEMIEPYETQRQRKDGSFVDVAVTISPIKTAEAEMIGVSMTARDISLQKQLEQERAQLFAQAEIAREQAEAANRSKDEFVSLVAHELRSPLNSIMGWAKLLQSRSFDVATVNKALDTIARNAQAQAQLIEDLLDVSRMVRGSLRMTMTSVNLEAVIEAAVETVRLMAEAKHLQLEIQLHRLAPISGDFQRLQQVVLNLLTNAIKFTPEGGRVEILLDLQDAHARIQIRDTGKGISPDFLPHIFERFRQDQQKSTAKQGLGLGLAIVQYIVEQHGGTITAESEGEGRGASFTVLLPQLQQGIVAVDESLVLLSDGFPLSLAGIRILLVDDDLNMLNLTAFVLEQFHAIVQTASEGTVALQYLPQFRPDLLISDIAMPEMTGYELLHQVRMMVPEGQIPAIALTAYASEAHQEDSLQAGFAYHLTKPVEPEALASVILNVMQRGIG